jgi:hypothetical protein
MSQAALKQMQRRTGLHAALSPKPIRGRLLQRKCACGTHTVAGGECEECGKKKRRGLQTKLKVNEPGDIYEQEADRIADQVMAKPAHRGVSGGSPRIQRFARQPTGQMDAMPVSVDQALASPGRPLDPALRQDMEQRFGHDFSQVRVHVDNQAAHSAHALRARAYTFGRDIVFGCGQFEPSTQECRKLLAHELTHVIQQREAPADSTRDVPGTQTSRAPEPIQIRRKPQTSPAATACPPLEPGAREAAARSPIRLVERIPQQEWLIYGFPIGGSTIAGAGTFIEQIIRSLSRGYFVYVTGQDPLEVLGLTDCTVGPKYNDQALRKARAANFCAGVQEHFSDAPKSFASLIRSCEAAPDKVYAASNATAEGRSQNRGILIRKVARRSESPESADYPFDSKYAPSETNCAAYKTDLIRENLGPIYASNAHCSCLVTPDEPHNNCVRACLQDKMWTLLAWARKQRPNRDDPPLDVNIWCPEVWKHHRECYAVCGCDNSFIDFLAFDGVCNVALPCAVDSAAINVLNRCMKNWKK